MSKKGVLLLNLGSPEALTVPAVREYLNEFLMDGRVIDLDVCRAFGSSLLDASAQSFDALAQGAAVEPEVAAIGDAAKPLAQP